MNKIKDRHDVKVHNVFFITSTTTDLPWLRLKLLVQYHQNKTSIINLTLISPTNWIFLNHIDRWSIMGE